MGLTPSIGFGAIPDIHGKLRLYREYLKDEELLLLLLGYKTIRRLTWNGQHAEKIRAAGISWYFGAILALLKLGLNFDPSASWCIF